MGVRGAKPRKARLPGGAQAEPLNVSQTEGGPAAPLERGLAGYAVSWLSADSACFRCFRSRLIVPLRTLMAAASSVFLMWETEPAPEIWTRR